MSVINLYNEQTLVNNLMESTINLIHSTKDISTIKKLLDIYDVFETNTFSLLKYKNINITFDEVWLNNSNIKHLNYLRCSLLVYHHKDFFYTTDLLSYNRQFCSFLQFLLLRLENMGVHLDIVITV